MRWQKVVGLGLLLVGCGGISTSGSGGSQGSSVGKGETSEPDTDPPPQGSGGTNASGASGRPVIGGTATTAGGGAPVGSGGVSSTAGTSPAHGGAEPQPTTCDSPKPQPPEPATTACRGIKTGAFCATQGLECSCLRCGLADLGHRSCFCDSTWQCSACQFPSTFEIPPDLPQCTDQADKLPCTTQGQLCDNAPGGEMCMCYQDEERQLIWDCDKPPAVLLY